MVLKLKKFIKLFSMILLYGMVLLFCFFPMANFGTTAFAESEAGSYAEGSINKDGKLKLTFTVLKSDLETYNRDLDGFTDYIEGIIKSVNSTSSDNDMVTLKSISDHDSTYEVVIKTRRINSNLKGMGDFAWSKLSTFTAQESDTYTRLSLMSVGNLRCMLAKPFGSLVGSVEIESGTKKNQVYIKPKDAMTNEELTVEEFSQAGAQSSSKTYLAMFRVPDVKGLQKVTIKLPGKVKYVSSTCINVVDESTIEIVPVSLVANVMKQEYVLDEEGNFTYDDSGVVITTTVVERDVEVSCMFGYVAYEHSPNYALITVLCILGVGVVTFIVLGFVKGWFAKFFGIAPKLPVEESLS